MTKETLFNKLREKGIFWSYSKDISYQEAGDNEGGVVSQIQSNFQ